MPANPKLRGLYDAARKRAALTLRKDHLERAAKSLAKLKLRTKAGG
jgi:hypothetical protein